nr:uncharacterized protein LOC111418671 [Onthophagus taurus]
MFDDGDDMGIKMDGIDMFSGPTSQQNDEYVGNDNSYLPYQQNQDPISNNFALNDQYPYIQPPANIYESPGSPDYDSNQMSFQINDNQNEIQPDPNFDLYQNPQDVATVNDESSAEEINSNFPPISCPTVFKYNYDPKYGGYYGFVQIPRPSGDIKYDAEINMTINRPVSQQDNIKLQLMSTANEIYYGQTLEWAVKFPYQDLLPKLTQIKFNGMVICSNYPDPLIPGVTQSSMWAKSSISSGKKDTEPESPQTDLRKKRRKKSKKRRKNRKNQKGRRKVPYGVPAPVYTASLNPYAGLEHPDESIGFNEMPGGPIQPTRSGSPYLPYGLL